MEVKITKVIALYPNKVFLQWDLSSVTESGSYTFDIERSGGPEGPWDTLSHALPLAYNFLDDLIKNYPTDGEYREGANLFSHQRSFYYRVLAIPPSGRPNAVYSSVAQIEPNLDKLMKGVKRKLLYDEGIALRKINGIELIVLKRKHWGVRCLDCWDPITKEVLQEDCSECYGTSYVGGFWNPLKIHGRIAPQPIQTQVSPQGMVETAHTRVTILDYPELDYGDVLIDLKRNERYLVRAVTPTTLKTITVHQVASISLLEHEAIEYNVAIDPNTIPALY